MNPDTVERFVLESNRIEGIVRPPTRAEFDASFRFLELEAPTVEGLCEFVAICAGAKLRAVPGMNVVVGDHVPRPGGPNVCVELQAILDEVNYGARTPFAVHVQYEHLHPFMDGNGRSGRILWAWQMVRQKVPPGLSLGFLHAWYYQSLSGGR